VDRLRVEPRSEQAKCPYCHEVVAPADEKAPCLACMAWHHRACRDEHGSCAACGATEGDEKKKQPPPVRVQPIPQERPPSWWAAQGPAPWTGNEPLAEAAAREQPKPIGGRAILVCYVVMLVVLTLLVSFLGR